MEIRDIKNTLTITEVATALEIPIGKNQRAHCPFHNDKIRWRKYAQGWLARVCSTTSLTQDNRPKFRAFQD